MLRYHEDGEATCICLQTHLEGNYVTAPFMSKNPIFYPTSQFLTTNALPVSLFKDVAGTVMEKVLFHHREQEIIKLKKPKVKS